MPRFNTPPWIAGVDGSFEDCANLSAPINAYNAFMQWATNSLTGDDLSRAKEGEASTWPYPRRTEEIGITSVLQAMFAAVYTSDTQPPPNPKSCARRILVKVHTDRFEAASFRVYHGRWRAPHSLRDAQTSWTDGTQPRPGRCLPCS